ncbi:nuclear transport factor 2 family protein [Haliea sp. E17]|uniref:nuclear transport factor 2 family protein n=1 Tax=Haliea sp. E17 TaxID=3401576 RepID=UPI003AB0E605
MQKTIHEVLAEAAIRDVQMRYCRAADRVDFDLFRSCFHGDAVLQFSFFTGSVDQFIAMAEQMLRGFVITTHFTGNALIEVRGDLARCEFYTLATHRIAADEKGPERDYVTAVRYIDQMECRDSDWRIARRHCVLDWGRTDAVPEYCEGDKVGAATRDRSDPSYAAMLWDQPA